MKSSIERFVESNTDLWDAILLLDVLEHFERAQGEAILSVLCSRLPPGGRLFVGTPAVWMDQGAAYGNEFERHRSLWTAAELRSLGFELLDNGTFDRFGNQMLLGVVGKAGRIIVGATVAHIAGDCNQLISSIACDPIHLPSGTGER